MHPRTRRAAFAVAAAIAATGGVAAAAVARPVVDRLGSAPGTETASLGLAPAVVAELATADPTDVLRVFVHAADGPTAEAAALDAGLVLQETWEKVGVTVAVGLPDQIRLLDGDARVRYVEADAPLDYALDTSHQATRGAEVIAGFDVTTTEVVDGGGGGTGDPEDPPPTKGNGKGKGKGLTKPGKGGSPTTTTPTGPTEVTTTRTYAFDGSGVSIAIVDSGIDGTHPFFADPVTGESKVARNLDLYCSDALPLLAGDDAACEPAWIDSVTGDSDTDSAGGHGTHVAGIAAGYPTELGDGRTIMGAAPGATLIGLSTGAGLNIYGGTSGLYWVLEHHEDPCGDGSCPAIKVVNNSWGSAGGDYDPESARSKIMDALVAEGVVVAFAQGNDGGDGTVNNSNPNALSPTPGVLGVANYDDGGTGTRDGDLDASSSRGQRGRPSTYPDIAAPGANILSSCRAYLPVCATGLDFVEGGDYNTISGTSMATPHIAGIVAQLVEAGRSVGVELTPAEIEDVLEDTAHQFGAPDSYELDASNPDHPFSFDKGHGLVDVVEAVTRIVSPGGTATPLVSTCVADAPVVVDVAGDASAVVGQATPLPSQPALDILEGRVSELDTDGDGADDALAFALTVDDLAEAAPVGAFGEYFDWNFSYAGGGFYLGMGWNRTAEPSFVVGRFETTRTTLAAITGTYDVDADVVTGILPYDALNVALGGAVPVIADGSVLGGHEIVARYDFDVVVPDADSATGACPYTVGLGAVPPPPGSGPVVVDPGGDGSSDGGLPDGEADGAIDAGGSVTFTGAPGTALGDPVGAGLGGVGITADQVEAFTIDLLAAGPATVDLVGEQGEVQDFDLVVRGQDGEELGSSAEVGGIEQVVFDNPSVQRITVEVIRYSTVEAGYTLTTSLG